MSLQPVGYGPTYQQVGSGFQMQQYGWAVQSLSPLAELSGLSDRLMGAPVRPGGGASPETVALAAGVGGYLGSSGWGAAPMDAWAASGAWGNQGTWAAAGAGNQYGGSWAAAGASPEMSWTSVGAYSSVWSSGADAWSGGWGGGYGQGNWFGGGCCWSPCNCGCAPSPCDWMGGWHGGWCHPAPPLPERPDPTPPTPPSPPTPPTPPTPPSPPTPPAPPSTDVPGVPPAAPLALVPHVDTDGGWVTASNVLKTRLVGTEDKQAAIHQGGKDPRTNADGKLAERSAVWSVMQLNDQVLYDVDRQVFVTKDGAGKTTDKFTLAQVLDVRNRSHAEEQHIDTARFLNGQGLDVPGIRGVAHWDENRGAPMWAVENLLKPGYFNWHPGEF